MIKKISAILMTVAITFTAVAENARVGALGGCDESGDISTVLEYPVFIKDYSDVIQGTMDIGGHDGSLVGIKSLGSAINLGFWVPSSAENILNSDFFKSADAYIEAAGTFTANAITTTDFVRIPKLLLGIELSDNLALGMTVFYETARYKNKTNDQSTTPANTLEEKQSISNAGAILDANISIGSMDIIPTFGIYLPKLNGLYETGGAVNSKIELSSSSLAFRAGGEADIALDDNTLITGLNWKQENFQFKYKDGTTNTKSDKYKNSYVNPYVAFVAKPGGNVTLISCYDLSMDITRVKYDQTGNGQNSTDIAYTHDFALSVERPTKGFFIFDELTPRMALRYLLNDGHNKTDMSGGPDITTNEHEQSTSGYGTVTAGFGVSRGIGTLDINANLASWNGAISGPSLVSATLTVDFKKIGGKSSEVSHETSYTPAPMPPAETDKNDTTETSTSDSGFDF